MTATAHAWVIIQTERAAVTATGRLVLLAVAIHCDVDGGPWVASIAEIADAVGASPQATSTAVMRLLADGHITRHPGRTPIYTGAAAAYGYTVTAPSVAVAA